MKKIISVFSCILYFSGNAQTSPPPVIKNPLTTSKGLKINSRKGTLIEKRTIDLAVFKTLNIQKILTTDMSDNSTENVLGIMTETETFDTISKKTLTIEKAELIKLLLSLQILDQKGNKTQNQEYTKYKFVTLSNIEFGCVYRSYAKNWIHYIKLPSSFNNQNLIEFDKTELKQLIKILKSAEEQL